ncbi:MAG: SCO family protein [Ardenticatenaceae bacterium]|nr:SCO family protein [Ardenticatenaceae bacterium]
MNEVSDSPESEGEVREPQVAPKKTVSGRLYALLAVGLLLGLLLGWVLVRMSQGRPLFGPPQFHGLVIQSPPPLSNFTLTATNGERMSLLDFRGKLVVLYFGYTFCPDVCPATMVELKHMMEKLGRDGKDVQVIMVSVDPERDTPDKLGEYVTQFDPSFIGMTGTDDELLGVTTQLGIFYQKHEGTPATGYLIDHTATVSVLDEDGRLRLVFPFGTTGEDMAEDLRHLLP